MECLDHLTCALDEKYIGNSDFEKLERQHDRILKLLNGHISFLKRRKLEN